jgi:hypothetical protein
MCALCQGKLGTEEKDNYTSSPKKNKSYDRQGIQKVHGETKRVRIGLPMSD